VNKLAGAAAIARQTSTGPKSDISYHLYGVLYEYLLYVCTV
jgi:hypothetical protein